MADICKCQGERIDELQVRHECPMRQDCYRFIAQDGGRQAYFMEMPGSGFDCDEYVPVKWEPRR